MFKNVKIKYQLIVIPVIIVIAFIGMYISIADNMQQLDDKVYKASLANKIIKNTLEARIAEKNYTRRKDPQYVQEVNKLLDTNLAIIKELQTLFQNKQNDALELQAQSMFQKYKDNFLHYQKTREESINTEKKMVKKAHDVEQIAKKVRAILKKQRDLLIKKKAPLLKIVDKMEKASLTGSIVKNLYEMRILEKNYILRDYDKYIKGVKKKIKQINKITDVLYEDFNSQANKKLIKQVDASLEEYKRGFDKFIILRKKSQQLSAMMKDSARKAKESAIAIRQDQKNKRNVVKKNFKYTLIILFFSVAIIITLISLFIAYSVIKNLNILRDEAKNLSQGDGDLTRRIKLDAKNEIDDVAHFINHFIKKVQSAIAESKNVSLEATSISNELSATSLEIGKRVEDESRLVQSVNDATSETTGEANLVDEIVKQMHTVSDKSYSELHKTTAQINELLSTVKETSIKEIELSEKMEQLRSNTNDVKNILDLIGDIAEQTNLLSLNAAIEAARAGEHGRGFAVVADEVRKLAERTQKSLVEINATINVVTQAVEDASDDMQNNAKEVAGAAEDASMVGESINGVMGAIEETKEMALKSSNAVDKLQSSISNISEKMDELNDVSIANARSVEEIAAAAEHQNDIIEKLNTHLANFKS